MCYHGIIYQGIIYHGIVDDHGIIYHGISVMVNYHGNITQDNYYGKFVFQFTMLFYHGILPWYFFIGELIIIKYYLLISSLELQLQRNGV